MSNAQVHSDQAKQLRSRENIVPWEQEMMCRGCYRSVAMSLAMLKVGRKTHRYGLEAIRTMLMMVMMMPR
eukprot:4119971-Karenia_brevis.AAC.1